MRKLTLLLALIGFLGVQGVFAQTSVTGTVTDADNGGTLPGVSVLVKGTSIGTVTGMDGKYSLQVPEDATALQFSFVGMEPQEVAYTGQTTVDIALNPSSLKLDEVVVTALGISREKKSLGYASQQVDGDDILKANNANPITALSGKVAGLTVSGQNFAGSQNILIRGASSFTNNNQPLFVIDGVPLSNENFNSTSTQNGSGGYDYGSMVSDLNSYDIESIDVLKGSAASALYGSRGQNGVIMITTKSAKKGKAGFSVEINSGVSFESVSILPELQNQYGGGYGFDEVTIGGTTYDAVQYYVDESWGPKYNGQQVLHWWGMADYEEGKTSSPQTGAWQASPNDVDAFYETGIAYQNSINITGSTEDLGYRVGYTNVNMSGIVPNSEQDKHTLNLNGNMSLFDGFIDVNSALTFVETATTGRPQFGYGDNSQSQKFFQWGQRQLDMEKLKNYETADGVMRTWNRVGWDNPRPQYSDNPYWTAYNNYQDDDRTRIYGTAGVKANITKHLNATGNIYFDTYSFNQRERVSIGSQALSAYNIWNRQFMETNLEGKLNYRQTFLEKLDVMAMVGGNSRYDSYSRFLGETNGGLVVPDLYNLGNSIDAATTENYDRFKRVNSFFGMVSFGWNNFIFADFTYRRDVDSSLPEDNNAYDYISTSASVILSELIEADWMDNLKVRANYGQTGNGTDPYKVYNVYNSSDPFGGSPMFTNDTELKNANLKPEETEEIELGFDGNFLKNRLIVEFSWYNRNTENQILPVEISGANGYTTRIINAGVVQNKGIELYMQGTPFKTNDWKWDIGFNFAKNTNTVKELPDDAEKVQLARAPFGGAYINAVDGASFQELYAYDYVYDASGNKVINEESGFYETTGELESVGSILPDYTAGVFTGLTYKAFDLNAVINISKGGVFYSLTNMWSMYSGMAEGTVGTNPQGNDIRDAVADGGGILLEGVNGTVNYNDDGSYTVSETQTNGTYMEASSYGASFYHGNGTPSATSVFDASYVKLGELSIGYTLPKFTDVIKSARISLYGRNLFVWGLDNPGINPETIVAGSGNIQGLEGGIIPSTRVFGFNLNIKF